MSEGVRAPLMAKSPDDRFPPAALTLAGHSLRVEEAAQALMSVLRDHLVHCFGLSEEEWACLVTIVPIAALLHDVGKATASFQRTVTTGSRDRHPWRHEFLSAGAMHHPDLLGHYLGTWLDRGTIAGISMVVAGHHLRARLRTDGQQTAMAEARCPREELFLLDSAELGAVWSRLANLLGRSAPPQPTRLVVPADGDFVYDFVSAASEAAASHHELFRHRARVVSVGKGLLVAADIIGSAHVGAEPIAAWASRVLSPALSAEALQPVVDAGLRGRSPRPFQEEVAASRKRVTLVEAGCGNGKTVAAYMWAQHHATGKRLAFCYPTTGTTSAGFADYLLAQSSLERRLLHSRAALDVEAFGASPDEEDDPMDLWARNYFERWSSEVVACTADTVLGLMTNWRSAMASLPLLCQCAYVFDEIHSYDAQLFGALLTFIEQLPGAPILLMTASWTASRRKAVCNAAGAELSPIAGAPKMEAALRYRIQRSTEALALLETRDALASGNKVLWVVNTVRRAQEAYRKIRDQWWADYVLLYHSRFRYEDRVARQAEVLQAFGQSGANGVIVVATQVCEMSLDISADLLITECAPLPSLIQRLGRLNRREETPTLPKRCLVLPVSDHAPYDRADLDDAAEWAAQVQNQALSQLDLAKALARIPEPPFHPRSVPFKDQTVETFPEPLRAASRNCTVIREADLTDKLPTQLDLQRHAIEMPSRRDLTSLRRVRGVLVVSDRELRYNPAEGASWVN